jgi:hypothetical protein
LLLLRKRRDRMAWRDRQEGVAKEKMPEERFAGSFEGKIFCGFDRYPTDEGGEKRILREITAGYSKQETREVPVVGMGEIKVGDGGRFSKSRGKIVQG